MMRAILVAFIVTQFAVCQCSSSYEQSCQTKVVQSIPGSPCSGNPLRVALCTSSPSSLQSLIDDYYSYFWNFSSSECTLRSASQLCSLLSIVVNSTVTPKADSAWGKAACAVAAKCSPLISCASDADCTDDYSQKAYNFSAVSYCGSSLQAGAPKVCGAVRTPTSEYAGVLSGVCTISDADLTKYMSSSKSIGTCADTDCESNMLSQSATSSVPSSVTINGLNSDLESVVHYQCDKFKESVAQSVKSVSGVRVSAVHVSKICKIGSCKNFLSATRRSHISIPTAREVGMVQGGIEASVLLNRAVKAFVLAQHTLPRQGDSYLAAESHGRVRSLTSSETSENSRTQHSRM